MIKKSLLGALLVALMAGAAHGHDMKPAPAADCSAAEKVLPPALASWAQQTRLASAANAPALPSAVLTLGHGGVVALHPTRQVKYVTQPEKPGGSVASGGMLTLAVTEPGRYQISLGSGAWIDLLKDGTALKSVAHAPGPRCSGIRKTVVFELQPGSYVLQISANAAPEVTVMVTRRP